MYVLEDQQPRIQVAKRFNQLSKGKYKTKITRPAEALVSCALLTPAAVADQNLIGDDVIAGDGLSGLLGLGLVFGGGYFAF